MRDPYGAFRVAQVRIFKRVPDFKVSDCEVIKMDIWRLVFMCVGHAETEMGFFVLFIL